MRSDLLLQDGNAVNAVEDDVEAVLENNKRLRSQEQKTESWRHTSTIPAVVLTKWLHDEWNRGNTKLRYLSPEFNALITRKLADPDWAYLRTDGPQLKSGWRKR
jgi:hypothetical protein